MKKVLAFAVLTLLTLTTFNKPVYGFVERGSYADEGDTVSVIFLAEVQEERKQETEEGKESKPEGTVVITNRV